MFTEDKVTEIFCMADDFCKFFDSMMAKYTIPTPKSTNTIVLAHFPSQKSWLLLVYLRFIRQMHS